MNTEIVERSSGWWVVNEYGPLEGPFDTMEEAMKWRAENCSD